jgi:hypothetical protein
MSPPDPVRFPSSNPYLRALREELDKQRRSPFTSSLHGLIDALDRHSAEQDRRIAVLERLIEASSAIPR